MEMRQLRYFQAVAEELHFGRAAERMHIAQPPFSQQIRKLEEGLGVRLLNRTSRKVELTPEGERFLGAVQEILNQVEGAVHAVRAMARGEEGRLRIAFVGPASESMFPEALRDFRKENPKIHLTLRELGTENQLEALRNGNIDFGMVRRFNHSLTGFRHELFSRDNYVLALPEGHRLAEMKSVPLKCLQGEPLVFFPRHYQPELYDTLISLLCRAGVTPNIVQEAVTKQTTSALVAAGLGLAFLHGAMRKVQRAGVVYRPIEGEFPLIDLEVVWRPEAEGPVMQRFLAVLRRYAGSRSSARDWPL